MKITWFGQAGLMFESGGEIAIVDPYLSDSVAENEPNKYRRIPVDERFFNVKPDYIILTHDHGDHTDEQTLKRYIGAETQITALASFNSFGRVRKFGGNNNYVKFDAGTSWTGKSFVFRAVPAEHSDERAIGVIIYAENKAFYVTGDTLYNERVFAALPDTAIDAVFLPINGAGNNMNAADAVKFAKRVRAKVAVPVHYGMLDDYNADDFDFVNRRIMTVYKSEDF